jgi:hypothetical protein
MQRREMHGTGAAFSPPGHFSLHRDDMKPVRIFSHTQKNTAARNARRRDELQPAMLFFPISEKYGGKRCEVQG